ncbi:hypothetical protein JCM17380_16840 [Desulfosporosinus burensis]
MNTYIKINEIVRATKSYMNLARHDEIRNDVNVKISRNDANLALIYTEVLINYLLDNLA